jgi:type IV pilus assembly protein PilV
MKTKTRPPLPRQSGFMLIEVLVAILIFAFGVLSVVGLQVNAIKQSSGAKYRTDASLLANDLIGKMWVTDRSFTTLSTQFSTAGTAYANWLPSVEAALPGAAAHAPTVDIVSVPAGIAGELPSSRVTITVFWKAPNEPASDPVHNLVVVTQIK